MKPQTRLLILLLAVIAALISISPAAFDSRLQGLLWNTAKFSLLVTCLATPTGALMALLATRTNMFGSRLATFLIVALLFMPLYLVASAWNAGFGRQGWYSLATGELAQPLLVGWRGAVFVQAAGAAPWAAIITAIGLRNIDPRYEEQALLDSGAGAVFFRVTLVRAAPAFLGAALWVALMAAGEITCTDLYKIRTFAEVVFASLQNSDPEEQSLWLHASTAGVLGCLAALAMLCVAAIAPPAEVTGQKPQQYRLGWSRLPLSALCWSLLLALLAVPLGSLIYKAGYIAENTGEGFVRYWSVSKAVTLTAGGISKFSEEIVTTYQAGFLAATLTLLIALPVAWWARRGGAAGVTALVLTGFCAAMPGPMIGAGIIWLLNRESPPGFIFLYDRTVAAPVLATTVRALPIALLVCWYGLRSVSQESLDAAAADGAGPLRRFLMVALPQRWATVIGAWVAALAVTTGDIQASILTLPPGFDTLSRRIFGLLHAGVDDQVAGLSLINFALTCLIAAASYWLLHPRRQP